jgi:metallo-beta-lactamase family protein
MRHGVYLHHTAYNLITMKISFHGAARTVTGSKHLLHIRPDKKILLDCGMFQGMGKEGLQLNREWGFEPAELTTVIISHAHIDHIGLLPKLVKDGYKGDIWCTSATADLLKILLRDSARIQEADVRFVNNRRKQEGKPPVEPLYTEEDAYEVYGLLRTAAYNEKVQIDEDIELMYTDVGHILGSAAVNLKVMENGKTARITFSGDVGRYRDMILRSPATFPQADCLIVESTYGNKLHSIVSPATEDILKQIEYTCIEKKGKLIIPAFSVGRTQELLYILNRLELERRLPDVKYFVDSPLSMDATTIIKRHPECFNQHVKALLEKDDDVFDFKGLQLIREVEDSIRLNDIQEPCVIISASGMAEAGRVKHHIAHNIQNKANTIMLAGYCEPNSLGGRLKNGAKHVSIFGRQYEVTADVASIESLSAHGDYDDIFQWLSCQDAKEVKKLFLVHGEYEVQVAFRDRLLRKGYADVSIPDRHQEFGLGELFN